MLVVLQLLSLPAQVMLWGALADEMQNAALQVIQKHLKPGGMIYNFSKGR
jgi:hypothetical protein